MIELKGLVKKFGDRIITDHLDLSIKEKEFVAIVGRSGEGKSVLLKQIIGLIKPDEGSVCIGGKDITKLRGKALETVFKRCGYVFQFAALLDSLTTFENIGIAQLEEGENPIVIREKALEKVRSVGLSEDVLDKYPDELSGGMKKRVGLARTLMLSPEIIIYDEPTTGLDPISVKLIHELIYKTHKESGGTTLVISHDLDVFNYADTVAMLYAGKIVFQGSAKSVWESQDPFIHQFIRGLAEGPIKASI